LPKASGRLRRGWSVLLLAGASLLGGCYVDRPVTTAPAPGTTVLLDLNDAGRVALGDRIGASVARVEGVVASPADTVYRLRMSSVTYLNGQSNRWSGESLAVPVSLVSRAHYREFSRSRTTMVGVGIAAAIVALFASTDFLGNGGTEKVPVPPPTGGTDRIPLPRPGGGR
jgi:hypothetical protein